MAKTRKKADRERSAFITKMFSIAAGTLFLLFVMGHMSAVLNNGDVGFQEAMYLVPEHIKMHPLEFLVMNPYIAYFGGLGYILFLVITFSKQTLPQGEMKGTEHGSSDFQTADERMNFILDNTTEILELDTTVVEAWVKRQREELCVSKKKGKEKHGLIKILLNFTHENLVKNSKSRQLPV
jgi:hypothetical protein